MQQWIQSNLYCCLRQLYMYAYLLEQGCFCNTFSSVDKSTPMNTKDCLYDVAKTIKLSIKCFRTVAHVSCMKLQIPNTIYVDQLL